MLHRLQHLPETWQEKLGDVGVTAKKERFCFYIPEQGSVYVLSLIHILQPLLRVLQGKWNMHLREVFLWQGRPSSG